LFNLISRKSSVTAETLQSYNDLLKNAATDLEAHLENINEKLTQKPSGSFPGTIDSDAFPERVTNMGQQEDKNRIGDPISLGSGLLTLVVFAFQSSNTLCEAFKTIRNNPRAVRELKEELDALNMVLKYLEERAKQTETTLSGLNLPLLSCGKACEEFTSVVTKYMTRSEGSRTSVRDWARLSLKGDDIDGFRSLIAGYKSTFTIALADANMYVCLLMIILRLR
jgi:hypothetical protein